MGKKKTEVKRRRQSVCLSVVLIIAMAVEALIVNPAGIVVSEVQAKAASSEKRTFVHPGMIHTADSFAAMKKNIENQVQPNLDTWNSLYWDGFSNASWNPRVLETVIRGGTGNNYAQFYIDIRRAYQTALVWNINGSADHGEAACRILNGWSAALKSVQGSADRFLAAGIYGYELANAAEIMRDHPSFQQEPMKELLLNVFYPMNDHFLKNHNDAHIGNYWANWDLCNIASMMAIGIFCDREDIYEQALEYYKTGLGNGSIYNAMPYVFEDGTVQWQESGRDQGHTTFGISLCEVICEMAWNQGDDLYGLSDNRLLKAAEYVAKYNSGEEVDYAPYEWLKGQNGTSEWKNGVSEAGRGSVRPIYSMVYNHYVNRKGLSAPTLEKILYPSEGVYIEGAQGNGDELGWQTLTFANNSNRVEDKDIRGDFEDGVYRIRSVMTGKSLVVNEAGNLASADTGTKKEEWWRLQNKGDGEYIVTNAVTGKVMQVNDAYYSYGSVIGTGERTGALNQNIAFVKNDTGDYRIIPTINYLVFALEANGTADETAIIQWRNNSGSSQRWTLEKAADMGIELSFDNEKTGFSGTYGTAEGNYTLVDHRDGKALALDGEDDYLTLASKLGGSILADAEEGTISFEAKPESGKDNWIFYAAPNGVSSPKNYLGILEKDGRILVKTEKGTLQTEENIVGAEEWFHVSVVLTQKEAVIYINGKEQARQSGDYSITGLSSDDSVMYIGKTDQDSDGYYKGLLDNIVITGRAMTKGEIKKEAAKYTTVETPETLAEFNFDDEQSGFAGGEAVASGSYKLVDHDGGKAVYLDGKTDFLKVTGSDGGSLMAGGLAKELTISVQVKPEGGTGWLFYAAPNEKAQTFLYEKYLGVIDQNGTVVAERYCNQGERSASASGSSKAGAWHYLTIVYSQKEIVIYDNGEEQVRTANDTALPDILGSDSILYIGKANWGSGEYFKGFIDNYKIEARAWGAAEVKEEASKYIAKSAQEDSKPVEEKPSVGKNNGSALNQNNKADSASGNTTTVQIKKNAVYKIGNYKYKITNASINGKGTVSVVGTKSASISKKLKKIKIPKTVKIKRITFKVTSVGKNAFKNCKKVTSAVIGANVTSIGSCAFYNCKKLKTITIQGKKLKKVGKKSFKKISKKARIKVPKAKQKAYKKLVKKIKKMI